MKTTEKLRYWPHENNSLSTSINSNVQSNCFCVTNSCLKCDFLILRNPKSHKKTMLGFALESPRQMSFPFFHYFRQEINNNAHASQSTDVERIVYIDSVESVEGLR